MNSPQVSEVTLGAMLCPCCRQALPATDDLLVDEIAGIVARGGRFATLTQREMSIFLMLRQRAGAVKSREDIFAGLYWLRAEGEEPTLKIIDVLICKMRKKLNPIGVQIDNIWGAGYRIVPHSEGGAT